MAPPKLVIDNGKVVGVRVSGDVFPCESESMEAHIPTKLLSGLKLSEIPEGLTIKPLEAVENNLGLSSFADGSASASVEVMERRKHWDGDVGLTPYMEAFRQAIRERDGTEESDFRDDGDYIFLHYDITIS